MKVVFANLTVYVKSNKLESIISWHDKPVTIKYGRVAEMKINN